MRARTPHTLLTIAAAGAALALSACVTETVPLSSANKPANTLKNDPSKPYAGGPLNTSGTGPGNVAAAGPAGTTVNTHVAAAIKPLGSITYDGLTLPLITPDGKWIVTQIGPVPAWEAVLAEPGATPQLGASIRVFRVIDAPPSPPLPPLRSLLPRPPVRPRTPRPPPRFSWSIGIQLRRSSRISHRSISLHHPPPACCWAGARE
ncbi:MAG: hypothetical protein QM783_15635 [Phycisphaerales bacterium]